MQIARTQTRAFAGSKRQSCLARPAAARCIRVVAPSRNNVQSVVCQATAAEAPVFKGDLLNPTYYPTLADTSNVNKKWYVIDAKGQTLGRLATLAATYIRGKHSPTYSPSMDMGAYVIVINADQVTVTGNKTTDKTYFNHVTGRPGSYRMETFKDLQARIPERIIERAVKGMLPKGRLGRSIRLHLKVYKGTAHPHEAQQPIDITKEISVKAKEGAGAALLAARKAAK